MSLVTELIFQLCNNYQLSCFFFSYPRHILHNLLLQRKKNIFRHCSLLFTYFWTSIPISADRMPLLQDCGNNCSKYLLISAFAITLYLINSKKFSITKMAEFHLNNWQLSKISHRRQWSTERSKRDHDISVPSSFCDLPLLLSPPTHSLFLFLFCLFLFYIASFFSELQYIDGNVVILHLMISLIWKETFRWFMNQKRYLLTNKDASSWTLSMTRLF